MQPNVSLGCFAFFPLILHYPTSKPDCLMMTSICLKELSDSMQKEMEARRLQKLKKDDDMWNFIRVYRSQMTAGMKDAMTIVETFVHSSPHAAEAGPLLRS